MNSCDTAGSMDDGPTKHYNRVDSPEGPKGTIVS